MSYTQDQLKFDLAPREFPSLMISREPFLLDTLRASLLEILFCSLENAKLMLDRRIKHDEYRVGCLHIHLSPT